MVCIHLLGDGPAKQTQQLLSTQSSSWPPTHTLLPCATAHTVSHTFLVRMWTSLAMISSRATISEASVSAKLALSRDSFLVSASSVDHRLKLERTSFLTTHNTQLHPRLVVKKTSSPEAPLLRAPFEFLAKSLQTTGVLVLHLTSLLEELLEFSQQRQLRLHAKVQASELVVQLPTDVWE